MILSRKHGFTMLLPWKTASQTLLARLSHLNESVYPLFYYFNNHLNRVVHQHITLPDYMLLPESQVKNKLAVFIRNPYDRVYSGFRQLQVDLKQQPKHTYPAEWIKNLVMKQLAENHAQLQQASFDFDKWLELVSEDQIYESGRNTSFPLHPLHYWTHRSGSEKVDFVGKIENFENDFQEFQSQIGLEISNTVNSNVIDLEGDAKINQFGYRYTNRMSKQSIDKINYLFEKDFQIFSYRMVKPI